MSSSQTRKRSQRLKLPGGTATESARRQVQEVGAIAQDGLSSGAWIYPLLVSLWMEEGREIWDLSAVDSWHHKVKLLMSFICRVFCICFLVCAKTAIGLIHRLTFARLKFVDPTLIRPLLPIIFKGILMSAGVIAALFAFAYLPQVAILAVISGPLGKYCHHYRHTQKQPLTNVHAYSLCFSDSPHFGWSLCSGHVPHQRNLSGSGYRRHIRCGEAFLLWIVLTVANLLMLIHKVLLQKGHSVLVENGRQVTNKGGKVKQLGTLMTKPLSRFNVVSSPLWLAGYHGIFLTLESSGQRCSLSSHLAFELHSLDWNYLLFRVSPLKPYLLSLLLKPSSFSVAIMATRQGLASTHVTFSLKTSIRIVVRPLLRRGAVLTSCQFLPC